MYREINSTGLNVIPKCIELYWSCLAAEWSYCDIGERGQPRETSDCNSTMLIFVHRTYCGETTWVWWFAPWMHHEVRGGGKNPKAEGWGIFTLSANIVVHLLGITSQPCGFAFHPTIDLWRYLHFQPSYGSWQEQIISKNSSARSA